MRGGNEFKALCAAIKRILKQKKITYRDLARNIGISESGLKKILGGDDASFGRLVQIADSLDLSLADLLGEQASGSFEDVAFTPEQEKFFLKNMSHFFLYWLLVYERVEQDEAARRLVLTAKELRQFLGKLDDLGLLRLSTNGKVILPKVARIRWVGEGPFVEKLYQDWAVNTVRDLAHPASRLNSRELFIIRYFKLREESYEEFLRAQRNLEVEFVRKSIREMNLNLPKMKMVRWVTAIDDRSFVDRRK